MLAHKWSIAAFFLILATTFAMAQKPTPADEEKAPDEANPEAAATEVTIADEPCVGCGEDLVPENLKDAGFNRYVAPDDVREAYLTMDAVWMTDIALSLAEGERVLLRTHKSGLTSAGAMEMAGKIAVERGDKASLQRLAQAAGNMGIRELAAKFLAIAQTAAASRAADVDMGNYEYLAFAARQAKVVGSKDLLDWVEGEHPEGMTEEQKKFVGGLVAEARSVLAENAEDEAAQVLSKLAFSSRPSEELFNRNQVSNSSFPLETVPEGCKLGIPAIASVTRGWAGVTDFNVGNTTAQKITAHFTKPMNHSGYIVIAVPIPANHPKLTNAAPDTVHVDSENLAICVRRGRGFFIGAKSNAVPNTAFRIELRLFNPFLTYNRVLSRYTLPEIFRVVD